MVIKGYTRSLDYSSVEGWALDVGQSLEFWTLLG